FAGSLFVAYNYDMWPGVLTQAAFFVTLFILLHYLGAAWKARERSTLLGTLVAVFLLTQLAFLAYGDRSVRIWDVTEYKEFLIPIVYLLYAVDVRTRVRRNGGERTNARVQVIGR